MTLEICPFRCILYNYPDLGGFPHVNGENGYIIDADQNRTQTQIFSDKIILNELGLPALAQLDKNQVRSIACLLFVLFAKVSQWILM